MDSDPLKILLIEDNAGDVRLVREHLLDAFGAGNFEAVAVGTLAAAGELVRTASKPCSWQVVLLDLALPDSFGLDTLARWHGHCPSVPVIVLTGQSDGGLAISAVRQGAQDYLVKGQIDGPLLQRAIRYAIERKRGEEALRHANEELEHRVQQRTAELSETNGRLINEIRERELAQQKISALLQLEQRARAEVEEANRSKDEFLATLSHELRTPLNAILGWAEIMRTGDPTPQEIREGIEIIERNARAQARLVEDVLEVSRIICGKLRLNPQPLDLVNVLDAALASARPTAQIKHLNLVREVEPATAPVQGDLDRLQQVISNMLSNAIKFTPTRGLVRVSLKRRERDFQIEVADTGIGIRADFLPYVFDRFRQSDSSSTRTHGGLGLGLSIARHLVEMHGGTISVASDGDGCGTTFVVTLPALTERHGERPGALGASAALPQVPGLRVLVVEDDPDARRLLSRLLRRSGAEVHESVSTAEALALLDELEVDVLVSDIAMPGEDGYSLIRRLRASPQARLRNLPALALSAFARPEDKSRALSAGFQTHIAKPYEPVELLLLLGELVPTATTAS
ncbi:MAG: response regulator [Verrucomicrobia bacterium]|nr:response regulator [Verrucomicrobiota bacterium]